MSQESRLGQYPNLQERLVQLFPDGAPLFVGTTPNGEFVIVGEGVEGKEAYVGSLTALDRLSNVRSTIVKDGGSLYVIGERSNKNNLNTRLGVFIPLVIGQFRTREYASINVDGQEQKLQTLVTNYQG